jgi:ParB family chromosome partitioning protein
MNRKSNRRRITQRVQTVNLSIDDIVPDSNQPRKAFVSDGLGHLAQSLHESGQISPIVVRPGLGGKYMIIVGERRWRAAKEAGISDVECIVRHDIDDRGALEMQLAENWQREDIPPLEQAKALKNYLDKYKISQNELSRCTGIPQRTISDRLALLSLPASVHARIESGDICPYEAPKTTSLPPEHQEAVAEAVSIGKLSGRALEKLPRLLKEAKEKMTKDIIDQLVSVENPPVSPGGMTKPNLDEHAKCSKRNNNVVISSPEAKYKSAAAPEEANIFVVTTKKYEISSMLLLIAKHVCEVEWNWPKMSVDDFVDTYLYYTMKQRGIVIGAHMKEEDHDGGNK